MLTSREIDRIEEMLVGQGRAFFHVSGAGHESTAALARHLRPEDWLLLHYRDKALLLMRGLSEEEFLRSFLCQAGSHSDGRQMSAHFSAPHLNVTSMVGPVGNNALHAVGIAAAIKDDQGSPVVICSVGDGTSQQGEFLEAIAEAVRWQLPVLFLIENNRFSISTLTSGKTFFDLPIGQSEEFYGIKIQHVVGQDPIIADQAFETAVSSIRNHRKPQIVVLHVERLADHTNADDQLLYRTSTDIAKASNTSDPVRILQDRLLKNGCQPQELEKLHDDVCAKLASILESILPNADPLPTSLAKEAIPFALQNRTEYRGDDSLPRLSMLDSINRVLQHHLEIDARLFVYGQDIEDPKGDVFGLTRGLSTRFPGRVVNSPLSESTIIGTSIGRALAGQRTIAFIQFADFLPLAYNQIHSELGSIYWRTNGHCRCPVVVMVSCGGYKPGLGPFHAQSLESLLAHTPGIDVVMPSNASDAAGLLNYALASPRPTIFFYPKACLNLSDRRTSSDVSTQFVSPGISRRISSGRDLTLVTWGNPVSQCTDVASFLEQNGYTIDLFDLRSLSPWDMNAIVSSARCTGRIVVVHEDNQTCGFGAEVLASVAEHVSDSVKMRRVCRPDTFIPCHFGNQLDVLPSFKRILEACAELLDQSVTWLPPISNLSGDCIVRTVGAGPADEAVRIVELHVNVGDKVSVGEVVAEVETIKSVVDVITNYTGVVAEVFATVGDELKVDAPLLRVEPLHSDLLAPRMPITREEPGIPRLSARQYRSVSSPSHNAFLPLTMGLIDVEGTMGSLVISNDQLLSNWPESYIR